jgi:hypothetical protein
VAAGVLPKLLFFSVAMIVVPITLYFLVKNLLLGASALAPQLNSHAM